MGPGNEVETITVQSRDHVHVRKVA